MHFSAGNKKGNNINIFEKFEEGCKNFSLIEYRPVSRKREKESASHKDLSTSFYCKNIPAVEIIHFLRFAYKLGSSTQQNI